MRIGSSWKLISKRYQPGRYNSHNIGQKREPTSADLNSPTPSMIVTPRNGSGLSALIARVLQPASALTVAEVGLLPETLWQTLRVRPTERGYLEEPFAFHRKFLLRWQLRPSVGYNG
jgi:hypothetical protein